MWRASTSITHVAAPYQHGHWCGSRVTNARVNRWYCSWVASAIYCGVVVYSGFDCSLKCSNGVAALQCGSGMSPLVMAMVAACCLRRAKFIGAGACQACSVFGPDRFLLMFCTHTSPWLIKPTHVIVLWYKIYVQLFTMALATISS